MRCRLAIGSHAAWSLACIIDGFILYGRELGWMGSKVLLYFNKEH